MSSDNNGIVDQLGRGLGGLFKFVVRLLFVLALAVAIGAGIYFGIANGLPALDRAYVQPVRDNRADILALEQGATQQAEILKSQQESDQARLTALEVGNDTMLEDLASTVDQVASLSPLVDQQAAVESRMSTLEETLATLDQQIANLIDLQATQLETIDLAIQANQTAVADLDQRVAEQAFPAGQILLELQLMKTLAHVNRSQLFIIQGNFGLAAADIQAAREQLIALAQLPGAEDLPLTSLATRLELAEAALPDNPVQAAADLEAAGSLLLAEFGVLNSGPTDSAESDTGSPTPESTDDAGPTATPLDSDQAEATPTP
jgi:hypothetical protein